MPDLPIIFENSAVLVLNKPAGLLVHPSGRRAELCVTDWLLEHYPALAPVGAVGRPGIVHRLDRDTSGALLVAKTAIAYSALKRQFQASEIKKVYQALVYGVVKREMGTITLPIGRSRQDPRRRVASAKAFGVLRPAQTDYEVKERFREHSLLFARPITGRTHQIRVHLKALGYPVLGDALYAPGRPLPPTIKRQALHAYSLSFVLPGADGRQTVVVPLPSDFLATIDYLRASC